MSLQKKMLVVSHFVNINVVDVLLMFVRISAVVCGISQNYMLRFVFLSSRLFNSLSKIGDSGVWGLKKNFALLELLERLQNGPAGQYGTAEEGIGLSGEVLSFKQRTKKKLCLLEGISKKEKN